jgi:hypothetical protein
VVPAGTYAIFPAKRYVSRSGAELGYGQGEACKGLPQATGSGGIHAGMGMGEGEGMCIMGEGEGMCIMGTLWSCEVPQKIDGGRTERGGDGVRVRDGVGGMKGDGERVRERQR